MIRNLMTEMVRLFGNREGRSDLATHTDPALVELLQLASSYQAMNLPFHANQLRQRAQMLHAQ